MGIVQEKRFDAPSPKTETTDYGATFVTVGTETPVGEVLPAAALQEQPSVSDVLPSAPEQSPATKVRKKIGRPKKQSGKGGGV